MRKKIRIQVPVLMAVVCFGVALFLLLTYSARATATPDTPDTREIMAVMQQAYTLMRATPVRTLDIKEFAHVFTDTSDFKFSPGWKTYLGDMLDPTATQKAGYLSAMQTKWSHLQQGDKLLNAAMSKAKAEQRNLTPEEWQALTKQNHNVPPPVLHDEDLATVKLELKYESIEVNDDKAVVRYDDGAALQEAILRKINGRWFIADITAIWVHF